jgi:uncharacterized membrane protein YfcA
LTPETFLLLTLTGVLSFVLSYLGAAVGLILGHLRLPLLVYILHNPIAGASTNLAVSGLGAVAGSIEHVRGGRVSGKVLLLMGVPSMVGAAVAVLFFVSVSLFWSHLVIGAMLVWSGLELLRKRMDDKKPAAETPESARKIIIMEVLIGLGLGALAAVTGLMLGSMRLPVMLKYLRIDPKVAVGSNMMIGCLTAVTAAVTAYFGGGRMDLVALAFVAPPTILGSYLGARKTGKISPQKLKAWVGGVVAFTGLFMVGQSAQTVFRKPPLPGQPRPLDPLLVEDFPDLAVYEDDTPWTDEPHPGPEPQPHLIPHDDEHPETPPD